MTTVQQTFVRSEFDRFQCAVQPTNPPSINQGDLMLLTGAGGFCTPATGAQSGANFLGVAEDTSPVASLGGALSEVTIRRRGTYRFFTTAGQTYNAFTTVYFGADAQTVSTTSGGNTVVGFVSPNQAGQASGVFPITGGAGVTVDVIIKPNYPDAAV